MKLKKFLRKKNYLRSDLMENTVGHFLIELSFNKHRIQAIIDSGASNTVFDKNWITELGYSLSLMESSGGGAGSSELEIYSCNEHVKIKLGKFKNRVQTIYAMDFNHINTALQANNIDQIHCIVGADYLNKYHAIIDYKKKNLYLKKAKKKKK